MNAAAVFVPAAARLAAELRAHDAEVAPWFKKYGELWKMLPVGARVRVVGLHGVPPTHGLVIGYCGEFTARGDNYVTIETNSGMRRDIARAHLRRVKGDAK